MEQYKIFQKYFVCMLFSLSAFLATSTTVAPWADKYSAVLAPIPCGAPVTKIFFFLSSSLSPIPA